MSRKKSDLGEYEKDRLLAILFSEGERHDVVSQGYVPMGPEYEPKGYRQVYGPCPTCRDTEMAIRWINGAFHFRCPSCGTRIVYPDGVLKKGERRKRR